MARERNENVLLFPFMAQGHIIPLVALGEQLERTRKGCTVTIVNTPLNIRKLRSSLPPDSSIRLVELPFSAAEHGLPAGTENTDSLPYPLIIHLIRASSSLRPAFRRLVSSLRPLCVLADIFLGWTASVSAEFGVFHAVFSGASGFGLACYYSIWLALPHLEAKDEEFLLEDFPEAGPIHVTQLPLTISAADGADSWSVFQRENLPAWADADAMLFNTAEEFDHLGLSYFRRKLNRPVWAALLPMGKRSGSGKEPGVSAEVCRGWLDGRAERSVLYICFGSHNTLTAPQMVQLGMALESTGRDFIWVVRPPIGFDINGEFRAEEWLPEGFEGRSRGLVIRRWAPQVEILSHTSVSAFVSHCGWNSTLEAMSHGVPIIGWPMAAEQFFNVKLLEEKMGVCVEVARGRSEVTHQHLADTIQMVMAEGSAKGEDMRIKATHIKEIILNSNHHSMDDFFLAATAKRGLAINKTQEEPLELSHPSM